MSRPAIQKLAKAAGCTKDAYRDQATAERHYEAVLAKHSTAHLKGIYECPRCGFWHTTSQVQPEQRREAWMRFAALQRGEGMT